MTGQSPTVPAHSVRWALGDAVLVLLGAQLLSAVWAGAVLAAAYGDAGVPDPLPARVAVLANIGLWLGYGVGPLVVSRQKGEGPLADYGANLRAIDVPLGLVVGVATQLLILPLLYAPIIRLVDADPSESARELIDTATGPLGAVMLTVSVAIVAPAVEELFYRGLLLRALQRRFGTPAAVLVSSAVFAAVHRELLPLPGLFVFGVLAAVLTVRSGRLGPAWVMHVAFNATTLTVVGLDL